MVSLIGELTVSAVSTLIMKAKKAFFLGFFIRFDFCKIFHVYNRDVVTQNLTQGVMGFKLEQLGKHPS